VEFTAFQNPFPLATHNLGLALNTSLKTHITQAKSSISISMRAEWIPNRTVTAGRGSRKIGVLKMESLKKNRVVLLSLVFAVGIAALGSQAVGATKTTSTSELLCIEPKSNHVIHPTSTRCPKGYSKLILNAQGLQGIPGVQSEAGAQGLQGIQGIQGIQGLIGATGAPGINGSHILQGTTTLTNEMGVDGDYYFNSALKTIYGPKAGGMWPEGVNLSGGTGATGAAGSNGAAGATGAAGVAGSNGSAGATGTAGTNATIAITELSLCDGPDAGTVADEKCKVGMTGPGGGIIFFVDYNDIYTELNYLEAAPVGWGNAITVNQGGLTGERTGSATVDPLMKWCSDTTTLLNLNLWTHSGVGKGATNTSTADTTCAGGAIQAAADYAGGSKTDWFLPSIGEAILMSTNMRPLGVGGFVADVYWSSSEGGAAGAWVQTFGDGYQGSDDKESNGYVRPVRSF